MENPAHDSGNEEEDQPQPEEEEGGGGGVAGAENLVNEEEEQEEEDDGSSEAEEENLSHVVDRMSAEIDKLELRVREVSHMCSSSSKKKLALKGALTKDKENDKGTASLKKQQDAANRESASTKRMQELMRQFATILRQIMQHKWSWPFMQPVDVEGLGLHDYYEVIDKPMDLSTVKNLMEAKDGVGYKNVREICADVRLVFKNAMAYNDEKNDVHVMAKTLLQKFEEKWLLLLPKVIEEEKRRKEEEAEAASEALIMQEAAAFRMATDLNYELDELNMNLEDLREKVALGCRMMTIEEKQQLGTNLSRLSPEDLNKALEIIAQKTPSFMPNVEEVDLDIDAQSPSTLWRLQFFVTDALQNQTKGSPSKRKTEISDAITKNAKKKSKNMFSSLTQG